MTLLVVGLALFLGVHSVRLASEDGRTALIAKLGEGPYKGLYSLVAVAGLVAMAWGWGATQIDPVDLWTPPVWARHAASLFTVPAFVLLAAAYVPGTHLRAVVGHPMLLGTALWAVAHVLANGRLGDALLFGGFLVWSVVLFLACRARDRAAGVVRPAAGWSRDGLAVGIGLALWAGIALWAHVALIGIPPFG